MKYRKLMASMDRFANVTDDKLEESGRVCIICRDDMTTVDCKMLPVCNHLFHKSCLREWLVQQQSCPTCRSDIAAMQAQERIRQAADMHQEAERAAEERQLHSLAAQQTHDDNNDEGEEEIVFEQMNEGELEDRDKSPRPRGNPALATLSVEDRLRRRGMTAYPREARTMRPEEEGRLRTKSMTCPRTARTMRLPALCRVSAPLAGAAVMDYACSEVKRIIPYGTLVLCLEESERDGRLLLKIPDGWIARDVVQLLHTIETEHTG
jgi:hypothetical protein